MSRVGPLVLFTRSCLDDASQNDAKNLRFASVAPTKKHEEEIRRQAFAALKSSKDDFVVLLGDRVENYKRRHRDTEDRNEEPGPDSAAYRPYVAHGGAPVEPLQLSRRFRFPPGAEAEKRKKQLLKREEGLSPRTGRAGEKMFGSFRSVSSPKHGNGNITTPQADDGLFVRADIKLDAMLLNPARALSMRKRSGRGAMAIALDGAPAVSVQAAGGGTTKKSKPVIRSDVFQEFGFPKAALKESRRRVELASKGSTLMSSLEPEKPVEGLFPRADINSVGSADPPLPSKESTRFFMTEGEAEGEDAVVPLGDSCDVRRSVCLTRSRLRIAPWREGRVSFADSATSSRDLTRSNQFSDAGSTSGFTATQDEDEAPPASSYRNHLVQHFETLQPSDIDRATYWRVRFDHTKCAKQSELLDRLEARKENRERAYTSARHLAAVAKLGEQLAEGWRDCMQPFGSRRTGDVWTQQTTTMDRRDTRVGQRAQLWRRVADYATTVNDLSSALQTFLVHLRGVLMETEQLGKPVLAKALEIFGTCEEAMSSPGVWAVLNFLRTELGLEAEDLADAAASRGVSLAPDRMGLPRDFPPPSPKHGPNL
eukprot:GGOE01042976.1.p1 GENE.GGOE01042976.1~~GGOE01042976.1.p1  ORF type:complete len:596 (+),score=138.90 GGOE01042976.1:85-1872(+)